MNNIQNNLFYLSSFLTKPFNCNMKLLFLFLFSVLLSLCSHSQDTLTKKSGEVLAVKMLEVNPENIKFKMFDNQQGPIFTILKSEVQIIRFENGTVNNYNESAKPMVEEDDFKKGNSDAIKYYDSYRGAGTVTLFTSLLSPLAGLAPAIACSSTPPKTENLNYPSHQLMAKPVYANAYRNKSKKIKQGKVWTNWGIGFGVNLAFVLVIISSMEKN
jgi:hypothetical protein